MKEWRTTVSVSKPELPFLVAKHFGFVPHLPLDLDANLLPVLFYSENIYVLKFFVSIKWYDKLRRRLRTSNFEIVVLNSVCFSYVFRPVCVILEVLVSANASTGFCSPCLVVASLVNRSQNYLHISPKTYFFIL